MNESLGPSTNVPSVFSLPGGFCRSRLDLLSGELKDDILGTERSERIRFLSPLASSTSLCASSGKNSQLLPVDFFMMHAHRLECVVYGECNVS